METSLHRSLKEQYATGGDRRPEVVIRGFRVDAVDDAGRLIEVQSGPLGPLRGKLDRLLLEHRIRIVKPVPLRRRIVRRTTPDGPDLSSRCSPRRGVLLDVFDDLIGVVRVFPHANLELQILGVTIDEVRVPRRRRPGYAVADRRLGAIHQTTSLVHADDLWELLPENCMGCQPFTTNDLAQRLGRPVAFAQRVAYCLRLSGAARVVGKTRNRLIYIREP
jgi:hypothetical protein